MNSVNSPSLNTSSPAQCAFTCFVYLVIGTSGTGKSTLASFLSQHFGAKFIDADDYHSPEAKQKMASGIPLTDQDRYPWLQRLADQASAYVEQNNSTANNQPRVFLACSALKKSYRELIKNRLSRQAKLVIIYLHLPDLKVLQQRLNQRGKHFFNPHLLQNQLDTLEQPDATEEPLIRLDLLHMDLQQTQQQAISQVMQSEMDACATAL